MIIHGDCLVKLKELPDNSVDSIVTDPPYGISFMGKKWDCDVPSVEIWKEVLRVLKPGGHLLSFGGTRTYHRMAVNIEDAGFEIRDQIQWIYGSGFPKSHNIKEGEFEGWGTALKPANEPICLARKPLEGTVAKNVLKHGTGALNIDASRIGTETIKIDHKIGNSNSLSYKDKGEPPPKFSHSTFVTGRWPANVIFDEEAAALLDLQTKDLHGAGFKRNAEMRPTSQNIEFKGAIGTNLQRFGDSGGASRFFYVAKASKRERNAGFHPKEKTSRDFDGNTGKASFGSLKDKWNEVNSNHHPTLKPIKLMEYLIKLVTPAGGIVLDPFCGSGSTGVAAKHLGLEFIGIEMNEEYVAIAEKRIGSA